MKIFLADLVHTWEKVSLWTFPLNVGFIGAYARAHLPAAGCLVKQTGADGRIHVDEALDVIRDHDGFPWPYFNDMLDEDTESGARSGRVITRRRR